MSPINASPHSAIYSQPTLFLHAGALPMDLKGGDAHDQWSQWQWPMQLPSIPVAVADSTSVPVVAAQWQWPSQPHIAPVAVTDSIDVADPTQWQWPSQMTPVSAADSATVAHSVFVPDSIAVADTTQWQWPSQMTPACAADSATVADSVAMPDAAQWRWPSQPAHPIGLIAPVAMADSEAVTDAAQWQWPSQQQWPTQWQWPSRQKSSKAGKRQQRQQQRQLKQIPLETPSLEVYCSYDDNHGCVPQAAVGQQMPDFKTSSGLDLQGQVWRLATTDKGSRQIQQVLEDTEVSHEVRTLLASELRNHVWAALKCRHANHVLQKCISTMRRTDFQFLIDELWLTVGKAARHRFGCRVLQRILEHGSPEQIGGIVEYLLADAVGLCTDIWGIYVMQHLFEYGTKDQIARLSQVLEKHVAIFGTNEFAPTVLSKAFGYASPEDRTSLARALIMEPGLLTTMGGSRHGTAAAEEALEHADYTDKVAALTNLTGLMSMRVLLTTRYGRKLLKLVEIVQEKTVN